MRKYFKRYVLLLGVIIFFGIGIIVEASDRYATGLELMDEEKRKVFIEDFPEVMKVGLNEEALKRLKQSGEIQDKEMLDKIKTLKKGQEVLVEAGDVSFKAKNIIFEEFPKELIDSISSYDGSASIHFPPIGDQGNSDSCVSWSLGYYQLTNNIANIRGLNAKDNTENRISPSWIHNLCKVKEDKDGGSYIGYVLLVLESQGAPFCDKFSVETTDTNFKSWNPNPDVWEAALKNRVETYAQCSILDKSANQIDLTQLKRILYNGYVVSFSSKYFGYLNRYMHNDRIICPEEKKGEWTLTFLETHELEELNSGHAMTIVGWDDTIQIDMDGDGLSDSEGALKVANSWGSDWGNQGFFWIPYDSLKPQEDEGTQRVPAIMNYQIYFMMPKVSYTPLLLAEVTLETNSRRQLGLEFGINTINSDNAYEYQYACRNKIREGNITYNYKNKVPFCFKNYNSSLVNYDFYGNELQKDKRTEASFVFDLTDLVIDFYTNSNSDAVTNGETRFYIRLEDNDKDGYSSVLKKIRIMDRATTSTRTWYENKVVDGIKEEFLLDCPIIPRIVNPDKDFALTFNYPIQEYTIAFLKVKKDGKIECQSKVSSIDDRKKIYIVPPSDGYQSGHPYSIDMSMIRSDGGNALNKENVFWFYVP